MRTAYVLYFLALIFSVKSDLNLEENIRKVVESYGYHFESFQVKTEDNYHLTLHRIPGGRRYEMCRERKPILLMHGLLGSSENWITLGAENALSFLLADNCYDVWLGNQRGNWFSQKHSILDPKKNASKFFDFTFHEIGYYDLPAMVDFILKKTRNDRIFYVGHSQGTTVFWVMMSERPEYNSKIQFMLALAPVAYLGNISNPFIKVAAYFRKNIKKFLDNVGMYELRVANFINIYDFLRGVCELNLKFNTFCNFIEKLEKYIPTVILSNPSAGASTKQLYHFAQEIFSHRFCKFDYGKKENLLRYKTRDPPSYNLSKILTPISIFYAFDDKFADIKDVYHFANEIPKLTHIFEVPSKTFKHTDFLYKSTEQKAVKHLYKHLIMELNTAR